MAVAKCFCRFCRKVGVGCMGGAALVYNAHVGHCWLCWQVLECSYHRGESPALEDLPLLQPSATGGAALYTWTHAHSNILLLPSNGNSACTAGFLGNLAIGLVCQQLQGSSRHLHLARLSCMSIAELAQQAPGLHHILSVHQWWRAACTQLL